MAAREKRGNIWDKQPCRHQGRCRRMGRRCSVSWSRDSPADPVSQAVLLQPGEVQGGTADTHWQHVEDPSWNRWIPNEGDGPGRTHGPMEKGASAGKSLPAGLGIPWGIHAGRACSPWKGPTHQREQGMSVRRSSSGEPGVAERHVLNWPQAPYLLPLHCWWKER